MKKKFVWIFSLLYVLIMGMVSYYSMKESIVEIFKDNKVVLILIGILYNSLALFLNVVIMSFIFRVVYKLVTKITLKSNECKELTFKLLLPILYTHALVFVLMVIFGVKSIFMLIFFLNPLIYWYEIKVLKEFGNEKQKIIMIIPFILYIILDIIAVYVSLI